MNNKIILNEDELTLKLSPEQDNLIIETLKQIIKNLKEKNFNEIIEIVNNSFHKLPLRALGEGNTKISDIYFLYATALKENNSDKKLIINYAKMSYQFNRLNRNALWLIREVQSIFSDKTQLLRLQVLGKLFRYYKTELITDTFKTIYTVAAENQDDAINYIKDIERPEIIQDIQVVKVFNLGNRPELPQGIYETIRLIQWFDENDFKKN